MELTLYGRVTGPSVATVGTWDPFTRTHDELLASLSEHARARGLGTIAVMLDPPPSALLHARWVLYDDARTRVDLLLERVDGVVCVAFCQADLKAGAKELIEILSRELTLAELWIGPKQTLGSGARGSGLAIVLAARDHGIKVRRIPQRSVDGGPALARQELARGAVENATRRVGRPPTRTRPASEAAVRLAWRPGRYRAQAWTSSGSEASEGGSIDLDLVAGGDGMSSFDWPSPSIEQLVFTRGPGDDADGPER